MMTSDDERYPGGRMTGYVIWIRRRWQAWAEARGHVMPGSPYWNLVLTRDDHAEFDDWLLNQREDAA
jgi:hypothetical protein